MTIPEPDSETLTIDLHDLYDAVYTGLRLGEMSVRKLISRAYHAERERDQLRARVAELEGHIRSLMPFMNMDSAIWSSICTKCGKMSYSHGRYLVRNGGTDRTGTCKHCPYMNAFHLMIPQPSSLMELEAKVKHG